MSQIPVSLSRKLRFSQIVVFEQVLRSGSILRAAQALNMTQSAVTKVVHELENQLGAPLLVRGNRGVSATEFGELVAKRAKSLLAELRYMTEEVNAFRTGAAGHVFVGTLISASAALLPRAIQLLKAKAPAVVVTLRVAQMDQLLPALIAGDLDLVVGRVPEDGSWHAKSPQLEAETLYREPLCAVGGVHHPLASHTATGLMDMLEFPWILPTRDSSLRLTADRMFHKAGLPGPSNVVESLSVMTNVALMLDQMTVGLMPHSAAQQFAQAGLLAVLPIAGLPEFGEIGCFAFTGRAPGPAVELFRNCLREAATGMVPPAKSDSRSRPS
ncbi:LysR family transcriptional regulator [Cupriavidus oxalaticus]|uniref:LysR family transcriptional regulator n=1 Tax=Cupriavidus oxalaticus TaxID=96344 RepID=A0A375GPU1_9BURK|nr:LysR substrate-binding domain-containing protein [Cupriavidus oxalaticus]QRQ85183.1 LysR family transcriptional regulator [Cupriavidus oxalaticus]QRQ90729.1 LysR family transcriptional regulator [Cupriavidus oxalaticus]WQD85256.1 LysR substrate-binding domain-containing protein [Cupriavidus oxalaticus]SPC23415.1 Transcriptional regulator, LysR family [Cupriavidus oxalaticus]